MTDRLTITPRTVDAQEVASIVSLVQLCRVPEAWERFQHAAIGDGALARLGGVINAALAGQQPQPAPNLQWISIPWGEAKRYEVPDLAAQTVVVPIVVPADAPVSTDAGYASIYEFRGEPWMRQICLSTIAGDFTNHPSGGVLASSIFRVGTAETFAAEAATLLPGHRYYFNARNYIRDAGVKPAAVEIRWPK